MTVWRIFAWLFTAGTFLFIAVSASVFIFLSEVNQGLPDFEALRKYEPPVMTRMHAANGKLMAEYAHQRRIFLPIASIPDSVKQAFLSAEDKDFYKHAGIDFRGVLRAVITNVQNVGSGKRLVGASTITQQVAKNFLLTNEQSYDRKIKEALLSMRIEQAFTKDQILELYLNEIYLGVRSYGVGAAALHYFDKSVHQLTLEEVAYLAALPKAPANYHPYRKRQRAIERRNWVIDQIVGNGFATLEEGINAKAQPLTVNLRNQVDRLSGSEYFAEEVRRFLFDKYGEDKLYNGGLSVRTTLNPEMQLQAREALMNGLIKYDESRGWRGPIKNIDTTGDWGAVLGETKSLNDVPEWRLGVILGLDKKEAVIGFKPGKQANGRLSEDRKTGILKLKTMKWAKWTEGARKGKSIKSVTNVLAVGDVVYAEATAEDNIYKLRQVPEISGSIVAMEPLTGRVVAMVGGFSFDQSQFNRATQAYRQPGSSFKPFVYAAALDNGYTPSSVVLDAPVEVQQGGNQGIWRPKNYGGKFFGPSTLRLGIEKSRNVMTVRLAQDMGMPLVAEYARRFGVYDNMQQVLSMALGAGETTVLRMTGAYSMLANGGKRVIPTFIDRIQDRYGNTIYRHDTRRCQECMAPDWIGQDEPIVEDFREQVLDPMTAYQITSMMEGVVTRGTATGVRKVGKPIAGKTGTTNDYRDAWFIGYSPDLVAGVFVGYDTPRKMGRGATGGGLAAPIFTEFMKNALASSPGKPFQVPPGIKLIPIDRRTGLRASPGDEGVILEAFKPGTLPPDSYSVIGFTDEMGRPLSDYEADGAVVLGTGGLY